MTEEQIESLFRCLDAINRKENYILAAIDDLTTIVTKLAKDTAALEAALGNADAALNAKIAAQVTQLTSIDAAVVAATPPPAPAAV